MKKLPPRGLHANRKDSPGFHHRGRVGRLTFGRAVVVRNLLLLLAIAFVGAVPTSAIAQGFFELSPGPLTTAHAELDNADRCTTCHELGKGVTDFKCLDCHQHQPLRDAIKRGEGLHAGFKGQCRTCHTEHKGRDAFVIDWGPIGGRNTFDHQKTGFALTGKHASTACTACHKRKLSSGRTSYVGLVRDCNTCHKNPHAFASADLLKACTKCHDPGVAKKMKPGDLFFDHAERTKIALDGKHGSLQCVKCHEKAKMTLTEGRGRTCVSCHKNPHGKTFKAWACTECHAVKKEWRDSSFDHDKNTKFPLTGDHAKAQCSKCHKSKDDKPKTACSSCHGDPHKDRFADIGCAKCHEKGGLVSLKFDHEKIGKFALTGAHRELGCRSCHRGKGPRQFEKFETADCKSCHAHKSAHNGQFDDKKCLDCHAEGGSKVLASFDHNKDARFALTGFHVELGQRNKCDKCHAKGVYRNNKLLCGDCHKDSHNGTLGKDCTRCHATDAHFKGGAAAFDHDRVAQFKLVGEHKKAECAKCHPDRKYKLGAIACVDCHAKDDPHSLALGRECEKCHDPVKGAPKFDHEKMTKFARTGAHLKAQCAYCHRSTAPLGPQEVGWTATLAAAEKADRKFPVMGKKCAECHRDHHDGKYGVECQSCHDDQSFSRASRAVHDTGAFRLMGVHDTLACARCHKTDRLLTGLGDLCQGCHREDDAHNNSLGPFCGECHGQVEWMPPRFNHAKTGFVLRGSHRSARCADCHGAGTYAGTPTNCQVCHGVQAMQVTEPVHGAALSECSRCHTEVAFSPARRSHPAFALEGTHAVVRCGSCHVAGVYLGTPSECFGCHQQQYLDPGTKPNHVMNGYSTACKECHQTTTFKGAKPPR